MIIDKITISSKTREKIIEQVEVPDNIDYIPQHEPTLEEKIEELKEENKTQDELINISMLATDEIFTMIEPILDLVPENIYLEKGVSKMVDLYVAMIQRGLKTIEQVPERYREEVRRILTELEK